MYSGFPRLFIPLLRCPRDVGRLELIGDNDGGSERLQTGLLACGSCGRQFSITGGVVQLLDHSSLDDISKHETEVRDREAAAYKINKETSDWQQMEIVSTLKAMEPITGEHLVLELGCGTGRFTRRIAAHGARVLAMDFSLQALKTLAKSLDATSIVGLVQADCTKPTTAKFSFNLALSTLVSNLPTREHRRAMFRVVSQALANDGRFVFSTHHHSLRSRLKGEPQAGTYISNGIHRYLFAPREIRVECGEFFEDIRLRRIQIHVPLTGRLGFPQVALSRFAESIPVLNSLAELLLVKARVPTLRLSRPPGPE